MKSLSNRSKIFLSILLLIGVSYGYHLFNVNQVKNNLDTTYKNELKRFEIEKDKLYSALRSQDANSVYIFDSLYSMTIENAKSYKDTNISFLFYAKEIRFSLIDFKYLNTLKIKVESELYNYYQLKKYRSGLAELRKIYGTATQEWEVKLDKEKFFEISTSDNCRPYFENSDKYRLKDNAISEFNRF